MNLTTVLQKAWQMLWHYKALWFFGAVMALVGANMIYPGPWNSWDENTEWTRIKITDTFIVQVPGTNLTLDFTGPEGLRIYPQDRISWREFQALVDEVDREATINLWAVMIEPALIVAGLILVGTIARYIAETALIRMVNETEETGQRLSVWAGLRRGWSAGAWRLFLLDLVVGFLAALAFIIVFGLAAAPILLAIGSREVMRIAAGVGTLGLLFLAVCLWLVGSAVLSLLLQPVRRACVLERQSLPASFRQGFLLTRRNMKDVGLLWLFWMGIRLLWVPLGALVMLLLIPLLLLTILVGTGLGGGLAVLVGAFTSLFISGLTPWILGALAGLPIFFVVTVSPFVFLNGLVEVYMSGIWTLAYRDLRAKEQLLTTPAPIVLLAQAHGAIG